MSQTYLVTGGAGFIGSNFIHYLLKHYENITVVNVDKLTYAGNLENLRAIEHDPRYVFCKEDICDAQAMERVFAQHNPTYVVNFAAESHVDRSILDPSAFVKTNVEGTVALLNAAKQAWERTGGGVSSEHKYLQVSTDEVYGSLALDQPDVFFTEETPLNAHSPYSASKAAADMFVMAYANTYGMPVNITRCSNNYGPYQFPEKLIPLMINNALQHKPLPVYGDGKNVRDWLYVEDHCKAIDMVLHQGKVGEIYNIGGHNEHSNNAIVKTIIEEVAKATDDPGITEELITYVTDRKGHDRRYGIDPQKISDELAWQPETAFEKGIIKTIAWYLDNQEWVKDITSGSYQSYYDTMYKNR